VTELEVAYQRALDYGEPMVIPAKLEAALKKSHRTKDGDQILYKGIRVVIYHSDDDLLDADPLFTLWL